MGRTFWFVVILSLTLFIILGCISVYNSPEAIERRFEKSFNNIFDYISDDNDLEQAYDKFAHMEYYDNKKYLKYIDAVLTFIRICREYEIENYRSAFQYIDETKVLEEILNNSNREFLKKRLALVESLYYDHKPEYDEQDRKMQEIYERSKEHDRELMQKIQDRKAEEEKKKNSTIGNNSSRKKSYKEQKSTVDPSDHDIEMFYEDYEDEFEDEDDAWDDFEDNEEYWDEY